MPSSANIPRRRLGFFLLAVLFLRFSVVPSAASAPDGVRLRTVVIDPGHGGHDPGAISGKMKEKDINLDLALRLGKRIGDAYPDVKVIYTRSTDRFVELAERSNIANRNHADLFISIHVNSARSTAASGTETFVMGTDKSASNMEVCKRENAVILLEDDYSTTYEGFDPGNPESYIIFNLMQNAHFEQSISFAALVQEQFLRNGPIKKSRGVRQAPLMVLWRTTMPSVLVEVGFLSNASDRAVMDQAANRQKMADDIFRAFSAFKRDYDAGDTPSARPAPAPAPEQPDPVPAVSDAGPHYEIQILAVSKKLKNGAPELKGETAFQCRSVGGMYKYSVGHFATKEEATRGLSAVRKKFPGAFVIAVE